MQLRRFPVSTLVMPGAVLAAVGLAAVNGCASDDASTSYLGDAGFGVPVPPESDAAASDGGSSAWDGGPSDQVALRVFHGIVNMGPLTICHDPDLKVDRYETLEDEATLGAEPATPLWTADAGSIELGAATGYVRLGARMTGALTLHRIPVEPMGSGDAGSVEPDAGAPVGDAGPEITPEAGPCEPSNLAAVLPLPMEATWLRPSAADLDGGALDGGGHDANLADGGFADASSGFATVLVANEPLTLFGTGLVLDADALTRLRVEAEQGYPQGGAEAAAAGRRRVAEVDSALGPRFLLSRALAPRSPQRFSLQVAHAIPDVPALSASESTSGPLHLCIAMGQKEITDGSTDGTPAQLGFRSNTAVSDNLAPDLAYRFRVFVAADFVQRADTCAGTSLKPVAELRVPVGQLQPNRSYTLVAWGALFPEAICTAYRPDALVRAACAKPADSLRPRLELIEN